MRPLKRAFSLIELLIVVALIAIIYAVAASQMKTAPTTTESFLLNNLDIKMREIDGYAKLQCMGEKCEECRLIDANDEDLFDDKLAIFTQKPTVYQFDKNGYKEEKKYLEPICFEMEKFENGSIEEMIFEYKQNIYHFYPLIKSSLVAGEVEDPADYAPTDTNRYFGEND